MKLMSDTYTKYCYWLRGNEFAELAKVSIESILRLDIGASIHVWCDDPGTKKISGVSWYDLPPGRPAMVANLDAQVDALNYFSRGDRVLFLDADTIVKKHFPWGLWADLYVTWRWLVGGDREMAILQPYNYGVLGVEVNPSTREAFLWLRARVLNMSAANRNWYGNQLALAELCGSSPSEGEADKEVRIRWAPSDTGTKLNVTQLPCELWNYTPEAEGEDVKDKGIIHVKGARKHMMAHYAQVAA